MLVTSCVLEMLSDTRWVINYVGVIVINIPISSGGVMGGGVAGQAGLWDRSRAVTGMLRDGDTGQTHQHVLQHNY